MKRCSHCKEWKDEINFNKNKQMQDGLSHYCKNCKHESDKKSWLKNKEKKLNYLHKWYQKNKEHVKEWGKEYRQKPEVKERHRLLQAKYREEKPELHKKRQVRYCNKHRDRVNSKSREYTRKYPERRRESSKKWRDNSSDYCKQYQKKNKDEIKKRQKEYRKSSQGKAIIQAYIQSEKGKQSKARRDAKRYRNLNWILLWNNPFPDELDIDYHHYNDFFVVPLPRITHRSTLGERHRSECENWIEKLYSIDIDRLLCMGGNSDGKM